MKYHFIILFLILSVNVNSHENIFDTVRNTNIIENVGFPDSDLIYKVEKDPVVDIERLTTLVKYPKVALQYGVEGRIIVKVLVSKDGKVLKSKIEYTDSPLFIKPALYAIKSYGYIEPALLNGENVACWLTIPITFKLSGGDSLDRFFEILNGLLFLFL